MRLLALPFAFAALLALAADDAVAPAPAPSEPLFTESRDPPRLPAAQLACAVDADCARVFRRCGTCDCGDAVARVHVDAHEAERTARCAGSDDPVCEMDCRVTQPRCAQGQCTLVAVVPASADPP